jgi:hypothetical protein
MIYVLIYLIVGVVVTIIDFFVEYGKEWLKFSLTESVPIFILMTLLFPIVLITRLIDGITSLKSKKKSEMKNTNIPSSSSRSNEDDPFEKEWQAFIKDTMPGKEVTLIERKIVVDNYWVSKDYKKMVMYLEDSHNEMFNAFIKKNHHVISEIFKQWGYSFMYAPKEMETIANYYDTTMPEVKWDAAKLLELQGCRLDEPIGTAMAMIEDVEWDDEQDCWVATMRGVQLDAENEHDLTEQIRGYWGVLNKKYKEEKEESCCLRYRMADDEEEPKCHIDAELKKQYYGDGKEACMTRPLFTTDDESTQAQRDGELRLERQRKMSRQPQKSSGGYFSSIKRKMKEVSDDFETHANDFLKEVEDEQPETLTQEDEQLLREIQERIEKLHHSGIRQLLIEQMVRMTVKPSPLQVTPDARILLTDYKKEVRMLPIDKVVYIFYLRHPEGISIKSLTDHKEELMGLYARVSGKTELTDKQKESVERLCDPTDNSINEKLSRIRKSFCAEVHESVADSYVVKGSRGENRYISLDEELIELGDWGR